MAPSETSADLAALEGILQQFDEIEPLHATSTHGTHFLTISRIVSPAFRENPTGKGIPALISTRTPAGPEDAVHVISTSGAVDPRDFGSRFAAGVPLHEAPALERAGGT